jgi:hypothetical protein
VVIQKPFNCCCICETGSGALDALSGAAASLLGAMLLGVGWMVHRKTS